MPHLSLPSPVGDLTLFEEDGALVALDWGRAPGPVESPLLTAARQQLNEYFGQRRQIFDLPLNPRGTAFQRRVWDRLQSIAYGQVETYGSLAGRLGTAPRPLGTACGRNPLPILIPCHRVVAADGRMGGYSGLDGIATKSFLLCLEGIETGRFR